MAVSGQTINLEQLTALNDEIAALVRAGVPLELGLSEAAQDVPSHLAHINQQLIRELNLGQPLDKALQFVLPSLPRAYSAVVSAGLKSGNLPSALESLSRFSRQSLELRNRVELALLYPFIVFCLAYSLLSVVVIEGAKSWSLMFGSQPSHRGQILQAVEVVFRNWPNWLWIAPSIVAVMLFYWIFRGRGAFHPQSRLTWILRLIPRSRTIFHSWHWSTFQDLLATLIDHRVPLIEALQLAGDASVFPGVRRIAEKLQLWLQQGNVIDAQILPEDAAPPHFRWAMISASDPETMSECLRLGAECYRDRANQNMALIQTVLPFTCVVVIGGGAVFVYCLSVFLPLTELLKELAVEIDL